MSKLDKFIEKKLLGNYSNSLYIENKKKRIKINWSESEPRENENLTPRKMKIERECNKVAKSNFKSPLIESLRKIFLMGAGVGQD